MDKRIRRADRHTKALAIQQKNSGAVAACKGLDELRVFSLKIAPLTVYHALNLLEKRGQVHRLESRNAHVACCGIKHQHVPVLSICHDCCLIEESLAPRVMSALSDVTNESGFSSTHQVIELHGRCILCHDGVDL